MTPFGRTAVGIDVGDGVLKAARLSRRGRQVTLHRTWRQPYDEGADPLVAAADALARFVRKAALGSQARIVIAAPTRGVFCRTYMIPTMDLEKLEEMVRYEVLSEVDRPPADMLVRHHVRKGVSEQEVHAYAVRRDLIETWRELLAERRVPYDALETPGFALASFVELEMPRGRDRILLAAGRRASELVLLTENGLWMRHLPFGVGHERDPDLLAARYKDEIGAAIGHLLPSDRTYAPHDLVLTEEGALDAGLTRALRRELGLGITRIGTLNRIRAPRRMDWDHQTPEQTLAMGRAFGLALTGLDIGRFSAPVQAGNAHRETLRLLPAVTLAVALGSIGLVALGETAIVKQRELEAALPASIGRTLVDTADDRTRLLLERGGKQKVFDALLAVGRSRPALFAPRKALTRLSALTADPILAGLRVEHLSLSPPTRDGEGVLTVVLHADPALDSILAGRIEEALRPSFDDVTVRGPEAAPSAGKSRFVAEVALP